MSQTKAQLVSGTTAQDLTVDNINTSSINSGKTAGRKNLIILSSLYLRILTVSIAGFPSSCSKSCSTERAGISEPD